MGIVEPSLVADVVVDGLRDERFLILPHPEVAEYQVNKATSPDRWIGGMRKLQRRLTAFMSQERIAYDAFLKKSGLQ